MIDFVTFGTIVTIAVMVTFVVGIIIGRLSMRQEQEKSNQEKKIQLIKRQPEPEHPTIKKSIITEATLINNRTDKETIFCSENEFGILLYFGTEHVPVYQNYSIYDREAKQICLYKDHSVKNIKSQTVEFLNPAYTQPDDNTENTASTQE